MAVAIESGTSTIASGGSYTAASASNRVVVFSVGGIAGSALSITGITMGSQAGTKAVDLTQNSLSYSGVWYIKEADIPSGSQTVTLSGTFDNAAITCYTLSDVDQTTPSDANDTDGAALGNTISLTITGANNGAVIASGAFNSGSGGGVTTTWTGGTEDDDSAIGSGRRASASKLTTGASESITMSRINSTHSGSAVSFQPTSGSDTAISANTDTLVITEQSATIAYDVEVSAGTDTLVITEQSATLALDVEVSAGFDTLVITENKANISTGAATSAGSGAIRSIIANSVLRMR